MNSAPIAEVRDLPELQRALRARAEHLQISRLALDDLAGLQSGYSSKLLSPKPSRNPGLQSLGPLLGGLGLKLLVVEDPEAMARIKSRLEPRDSKKARNNMSSSPRYRATADNTSFGLGFWRKGQEFEFQGWPSPQCGAVEPANEPAERIMSFWRAHHTEALFPLIPWNSEYGRYFLPGTLPRDPRSTLLPSLPRDVVDGMPRYRATWQQQFGTRFVNIGDEIAFCGWPQEGLEPINDAARSVVEYLEANRKNPKLLSAPWCEFAQALFLPDLPQPKKGPGGEDGYARDLSRGNAAHDDFVRGRILNAQADLRKAAETARRPKGARRRVSA